MELDPKSPPKEKIKVCTQCKARKDVSEFAKNKAMRDGLQVWCRACYSVKMKEYNTKKKSTKVFKDAVKLRKVGIEMAKNGGDLTRAYHSLGTTKNLKSAGRASRYFVDNCGDDALEGYVKLWKGPDTLKHYGAYLKEAMETGNLAEKRDALNLIAKLAGIMKDKSDISITGITKEERTKNLEKVLSIVEGKKKAQ